MNFLYQLLRPLAYLRIDHPSKWKVDWLIPFVAAIGLFGLTVAFRPNVNLYGSGGLLPLLLGFVQNLPGFYMAALAAIAVFSKVDIDRPMPPPTPTIQIRIRGKSNLILLTRRRFLCMLFAFLTAESFGLATLAAVAIAVAQAVKDSLPRSAHGLVADSFLFCYLLFFCQMVITTVWGLYYLGERIHQPDSSPQPE